MLATFGYIAGALEFLAVVPYIRDILLLKTKPERASWFIWTVLVLIAFFSQMAKGATHSLWLNVGQFDVIVVFLLSLKYGVGGFTKRDKRALVAVAIGLTLWYFTKEASYALLITIFVDAIGSLLTSIKAYEDPAHETMSSWVMAGIAGFFGMLSVGAFYPILLAYPLYIMIANFAVVICMFVGRARINEGPPTDVSGRESRS